MLEPFTRRFRRAFAAIGGEGAESLVLDREHYAIAAENGRFGYNRRGSVTPFPNRGQHNAFPDIKRRTDPGAQPFFQPHVERGFLGKFEAPGN